jgi:hypothetical protein
MVYSLNSFPWAPDTRGIWLRIRVDIRQSWLHSGANYTGVQVHVTDVSMTPLCNSQRHQCNTAVQPVLLNTFLNDPNHCFLCVNLTRLHTAQRYHKHCCDTAVTCTAVSLKPVWFCTSWLWIPWKGISIETTFIGQLSYTISITFTHKKWGLTKDRFGYSGVIDTAVTKIGDFVFEFLRESQAIF